MILITKAHRKRLLKNGRNRDQDHAPVVKIFTPDAQATWLISEMDPEDNDRLFGLCDLGLGFPELGYVSLNELHALRGQMGLPVERDCWWDSGEIPMSRWVEKARADGRIGSKPEATAS